MPRSRYGLINSAALVITPCPAWEWLLHTGQGTTPWTLYNPFNRNERGDQIPLPGSPDDIWTGANHNGTGTGFNCGEWTSDAGTGTAGASWSTSKEWSNQNDAASCGTARRLLCMQSDIPIIPPGNCTRFFTRSATTTGDLGGIAGGDATCNSFAALESTIPSLRQPAIWQAWLTADDPATAPINRFHFKSPGRYCGPCYEVFSPDFASLGDTGKPLATKRGEHGFELANGAAWTYTNNNGAKSTGFGGSCGNWTLSTAPFLGRFGVIQVSNDWSENNYISCDGLRHIYCFAQNVTQNTG